MKLLMGIAKKITFWVLFGLIAWVGSGSSLHAQGGELSPNRAALVVVFGDGSVVSRCVGFNEESISGYDLLARGGFAPRTEVTAMGASVCSIEGQGCGDGQDCFCQCLSSPCIYWTYWQLGPEGWRYFNMGAANTQVVDGEMQGWVWGESQPNAPAELTPPALAFADVCSVDAPVYGLDEMPTVTQAGDGINQAWMVALVVALPLLLGAGWWLAQRRKGVQP